MQALRDRFPSEPQGTHQHGSSASQRHRVTSRDYFDFAPTSPTVKAPSIPSTTPKDATTPAAGGGFHASAPSAMSKFDTDERGDTLASVGPSTARVIRTDATGRHSLNSERRTSASRKQVAAGDLAMTSNANADANANGGAYFRPAAQTPGLSRTDTWRGRLSGSYANLREHSGVSVESTGQFRQEETFELHEAVFACIAKSIGLAQPSDGIEERVARSSMAPSVSAASTPNSPLFPSGGRGLSRSPFGNVLDMLNTSTQNDSIIGGMLREAAMYVRGDDDHSSVSGSVQESQAGKGSVAQYVGKDFLRDLEGKMEILFNKKGSVLVREGEKSPGIYYVIDGFLEVGLE